MNIKVHFQTECNKRRIHIEQLLILKQQKELDKAAHQRLEAKIERERQQLAILSDVWNVE